MPRESDKFQIQLADHNGGTIYCAKCTERISYLEDHEYVILWPAGIATTWNFHVVCFGEVTKGMVEFLKVFIETNSKIKHRN